MLGIYKSMIERFNVFIIKLVLKNIFKVLIVYLWYIIFFKYFNILNDL